MSLDTEIQMIQLDREIQRLHAENERLRDERELKIALDATVDRLEESLVNQQQEIEDLYKNNAPLQLFHTRYEYLRRLNPRQFAELWQANINGEGAFDDLVDRLLEKSK